MTHTHSLGAALASACTIAVLSLPVVASAQTIPIREMAAPDARTTQSFGNIFGVRQLSGGNVLVNDGARRQLVILDEKFAMRAIAIDSATTGGQSYGPRASPLIPFLADSSLFVDGASLTLLVIDPTGKITRVMSAPKPGDVSALASGAAGVDAKGNLVYRGRFAIAPTAAPGGGAPAAQSPDSQPIVRADFDTRKVDTLGRVKVASGSRTVVSQDPNGKMIAKTTVNPLNTIDEWGVMSDGTVAFVRGQDYHIDFLAPDGKRYASAKLPFDWKRLTDEDKQALVDSARKAIDKAVSDARAKAANPAEADRAASMATMMALASAMGMSSGGGMGGGGSMGGGMGSVSPAAAVGRSGDAAGGGAPPMSAMPAMPTMLTEFVPLKEIADYYPAIRAGAVKADLDGNLWILPTSSAQSKAGELIYDIVNKKGVLAQRVRVPLGRSIAGFGHNGIVYLMQRDANGAWFLERSRIIGFMAQ